MQFLVFIITCFIIRYSVGTPEFVNHDLLRKDEYENYNNDDGGQNYGLRLNGDEDFSRKGYDGKLRGKDFYDQYEREKLDKLFGYTGPTANNEPENIMRPCALDDWQCIRKYFADNSKCTPAYGPIPDPLVLDMDTVFFSSVRLTAVFKNVLVIGLSRAKINDFYVNKKSGNLVFAIDVQNLNLTSPRGYFRFQRTAKESIVLADYATINFRTSTHTVVIPKIPDLRLDLADAHIDIQDGNPNYFFGPNFYNSTDPEVIASTTQFSVLLPFLVREGLLFDTQLLSSLYIQKNICDFRLKLAAV